VNAQGRLWPTALVRYDELLCPLAEGKRASTGFGFMKQGSGIAMQQLSDRAVER